MLIPNALIQIKHSACIVPVLGQIQTVSGMNGDSRISSSRSELRDFERACSQIPLARHRLCRTPVCNFSGKYFGRLLLLRCDASVLMYERRRRGTRWTTFRIGPRRFIPGMGSLHEILFFGRPVLEGSGNCSSIQIAGS